MTAAEVIALLNRAGVAIWPCLLEHDKEHRTMTPEQITAAIERLLTLANMYRLRGNHVSADKCLREARELAER